MHLAMLGSSAQRRDYAASNSPACRRLFSLTKNNYTWTIVGISRANQVRPTTENMTAVKTNRLTGLAVPKLRFTGAKHVHACLLSSSFGTTKKYPKKNGISESNLPLLTTGACLEQKPSRLEQHTSKERQNIENFKSRSCSFKLKLTTMTMPK